MTLNPIVFVRAGCVPVGGCKTGQYVGHAPENMVWVFKEEIYSCLNLDNSSEEVPCTIIIFF